MGALSAIVALLKEVGTPAIIIVGFAWVIFRLSAFKSEFKADMTALEDKVSTSISTLDLKLSTSISALDLKLSTSIAELKTEVSALQTDVAELKTDVSGLKSGMVALAVDVKSIKGNHLPHIEAAIKELAKGTPNEEHVKAILDLSHENEQ
jgi:hypothetical protein